MTDIVQPFVNHLPVRVLFGQGRAAALPDLLAELPARRVVVLLDRDVEVHNPAVAAMVTALAASGLAVERFVKDAGEPTVAMVNAATESLRRKSPDAIVAIGGGSVIDTAKAARLCHQLGCSFSEFLGREPIYPEPRLPLIAVPTTAGTGSEVSGGSVVSDPEAARKAGIAHPSLRPQYAIVDPELTWSMPPSMTAHTGIDALAQAIAAVIAKVRTPIGDAIALEAIRVIGQSLVAAYRDGGDQAARSNMACGSMMAGLAMNIADCTAEHSLGQAIGGLTGAPHGLTVGVVLAETLEQERRHVPHQLNRVADALGVPDDGSRDGSRAVSAVRSLLADLNFPVLADLPLTDDDLERLSDMAMADYFLTMAPHEWTRQEVRDTFHAALSLHSRVLAPAS